ncbi:tRNA (uridine(54)-C5)-methyltransferase TrmA [Campylobacter sp. VicNov18]|uniref:tRNA (uridine(54)-C5)-methyltransferase TrmA n=1 Tax=Campylobacter bilis TaxID=2691918 RepID=UPI00130EA26A|nr:tRNA (uridine(54)-C5)-methyltransferase TrmA [Campylobacter bilis]MPV63563.1 tRNA (uridine(54)-C5)-methyltransferase TrmA [Campylobacter hepaticus]MBM0637063.1 tRNA (uridine(54)-C5)-methyltransferase TrmA [Campylobacter bilis]MCC8277779.1 tRNA (uridine(54)-C5)-methyltransferase TrmA [Campylobacter bilis]MCC8299388.1 tRNA (uridine(54)-C5)-methyltransferase TrmA [Campylobacter bilis]MCC8300688.1 tRNA (uridine(54)-C5)-methyltransferase TrmA [Campylobacter bilis]
MSLEKFGNFTSLEEKASFIKEYFKEFYQKDFKLFSSKNKHYRTRAEFSFYHQNDDLFYAMFNPQNKKKIIVENLEFVDEKIYAFMPKLLKYLRQHPTLKEKLFAAEFLAAKKELSTSLLYHKNIENIQKDLELLSHDLRINLIARSKGKKLVFKTENLKQSLYIQNKEIFYEVNNDCFIQPNTAINEKMIDWVCEILHTQKRMDLLELYCGYGNFTLALAQFFNKILATEISKSSIHLALKNCLINNVSNIHFARLSSQELSSALKKEREFFRLKNISLDSFNFSHVLVDPPRVGLDKSVINLIKNYKNIIYISCNPITLKENIKELNLTHKISDFALFDQFVNTPHLECGVFLSKTL